MLPGGSRHFFFCHPRDDGARLQEDGHAPMLVRQQPNGCVTWDMNAFVCMETQKEFFSCYWTKWQKNCRSEGQDWKILQQVSPTQSHQTSGAAEKAVSTVRGQARTCLAVHRQNPVFEVTTHSPILPWTIRHAAWILTRYNVRRDTRMTLYENFRGQKYRKEILPLGEQVLARRPGANVNQLLQQG